MNPTKKFPLEVEDRFLKFIRYRYDAGSKIIIELVGQKKKPSIEKDELYWVPEIHRFIEHDKKTMIQYFSDYYMNEKPEWIEASSMKKQHSRYAFECTQIDKKKLKTIGKKEATLSGIFEERILDKIDEEQPGAFKTKPIEIWRFAHKWDLHHEEGEKWEDNPEIFMYHLRVHRLQPKVRNYREVHWGDQKVINKE
mgnify:CR=1 FL=1